VSASIVDTYIGHMPAAIAHNRRERRHSDGGRDGVSRV
jgi:hypothetical protein